MKPKESMELLAKLATLEIKKAFKSLRDAVFAVNGLCPLKKRNLTICRGRNYDKTSSVLLAGRWLKEAGFNPGLRIRITVMHQLLIINPEDSQ